MSTRCEVLTGATTPWFAADFVVARLGDRASPEVRPTLSTFDDPLWALLLDLRSS